MSLVRKGGGSRRSRRKEFRFGFVERRSEGGFDSSRKSSGGHQIHPLEIAARPRPGQQIGLDEHAAEVVHVLLLLLLMLIQGGQGPALGRCRRVLLLFALLVGQSRYDGRGHVALGVDAVLVAVVGARAEVGVLFAYLVQPFRGHRLHGLPHERVDVEDGVEVLHGEAEDVAVGLGPNRGHSSGVGQQADFAEVGAVAEAGGHVAGREHHVHDAFLDEVHLVADRAFFDDDIA